MLRNGALLGTLRHLRGRSDALNVDQGNRSGRARGSRGMGRRRRSGSAIGYAQRTWDVLFLVEHFFGAQLAAAHKHVSDHGEATPIIRLVLF